MTAPIDPALVMRAAPAAGPAPHSMTDPVMAKHVAQQFEGVFISQMLSQMFEGVQADPNFGGGQGEDMFHSMMVDEYGKQLAAQGGIGLSSALTRELLKTQENAH
jgi:Rod binding domain-containing protein